MRRAHIPTVTTVLLALALSTAVGAGDAAPAEQGWQLRFGPTIVSGTGGATVSAAPGDAHVAIDLGAGGGIGISLERWVSPAVGVEFGLTAAALDSGFRVGAGSGTLGTSTDLLAFASLTVGANFHLVPEGPVDVYAGPMLVLARYSELSIGTGFDDWPWWHHGPAHGSATTVRWKSDSEVTWGARLGAGFSFGRGRWSLETSVSYLDATYTADGGADTGVSSVDLDPVMVSIGAGFRF